MSNTFRIELALRAGQLAKTALELTHAGMGNPAIAHLQLVEIAKQLRELDQFITKEKAGMSVRGN